jgi:hypothetical protein
MSEQVTYCPNNPNHKTFLTGATVSQVWKVDETGEYLETVEDCSDVFAHPSTDGNMWECAECGAEGVHEKPDYPDTTEATANSDDPYKTFIVEVGLDELHSTDFSGFLDILCEATGNPGLMDVNYEIVSGAGTVLTIKVTGDDSERDEDEE